MYKIADRSKILRLLLINLETKDDFELCLKKTLDELKLDSKTKEKISNEIFANGINSLIFELNIFINEMMNKGKPQNFKKLRLNEKIRFLVIHRIKIIDKYFNKNTIMKLVLKQKSLPILTKMLFKVSDEIWFLSGDKSTDFNFYSKRLILMNIYASSFIFNLRNNSKDYSKTIKFIDKQIDSVLRFGRIKSKLKNLIYPKSM